MGRSMSGDDARYSLEEGAKLVALARQAVEYSFAGMDLRSSDLYREACSYDRFKVRRGVFTSIYLYPSHELRGCIGYVDTPMPLCEAVVKSALSSAFSDPRFEPMSRDELDSVVFEVSVLTPPRLLSPRNPLELPSMIRIGRDGLILEYGPYSALLLPQVPVEFGWSAEEYLSHLAMKAGLTPDIWLDRKARIYVFQAQVFEEVEPRGKVVEKVLV